MRALLPAVLAVALIVALGSELVVPPVLESRLAESLRPAAGGAVRVDLHSFPALRMLAGSIDRMDIVATDVWAGGLAVRKLHLSASDLTVDVDRLLAGEPWRPPPGDVRVEAIIDDEALSRFVKSQVAVADDVTVEIDEAGARFALRGTVLGRSLEVSIRGRFVAEGGPRVGFTPEEVAVGGQALPPALAEALGQAYPVTVDLPGEPLPVIVEAIDHRPGRLVVKGRLGP
ncbi:MAG: DUF2993 domain-containing protein [Firmicutes bacterium]|nr:DUF2993 domain-containing protein [Bacillota bacterium]